MGYARGVPYALSVAAAFPDRVAGLIVADYPAQHDAVPRGWITDLLESVWRGVPVSERLMPFVAEGIQREGEDIPLWDLLPAIACPTLIMYGGMPGARQWPFSCAAFRLFCSMIFFSFTLYVTSGKYT